MKKQRSIRYFIIGNLLLILTVILVVIFFSERQISKFQQTSTELVLCNQELGDFYETAGAMDSLAREFIYSDKFADYLEYQTYEQQARNCLERCRDKLDHEMNNRLDALESMLDYYKKPMEQYLYENAGKYETYELLQYRGKLIANTSVRYYGLLAESMSRMMEQIKNQWSQWKMLFMSVILVIILFVTLWNLHYWRRIYLPIQMMVDNTKKIREENYKLDPPGATIRELCVLEKAFADMAVRIQQDIENLQEKAKLEQELLRKENENLQIKNLIKETEFQNLQAQINPHFLFNTMNMISQSAQLHHDIQTSELMDKLSAFLRYTLDKSGQFSTLQEEIRSIENYIYIQRKRFGDRVKFVVGISNEVPNIIMPPVIIQPLIENAITHGVGNMTKEAEIVVSAVVEEEMLWIFVEDNGAGMNVERLEALLVYLHRASEGFAPSVPKSSIGLANVYQRLKIFYGEKLQFVVESEENCGTLIEIGIPKEVWDEQ